jgi:hypothetical protein
MCAPIGEPFKYSFLVPGKTSASIGEPFEYSFLVPGKTGASIGEPFEYSFFVPGTTLSTEGSTCNPKGFNLEPKMVILCGQPKNPFFLNACIFTEKVLRS